MHKHPELFANLDDEDEKVIDEQESEEVDDDTIEIEEGNDGNGAGK